VTEGYFDNDRTAGTITGEIAHKGPTQPGCLYTNNWIDLRIEIFSTSKSHDADAIPFQGLGFAGKRRFDHEAEKRDKLGGMAENRTGNNAVQGAVNLLRSGLAIGVVHDLRPFRSDG
jgi:hypothetical protein